MPVVAAEPQIFPQSLFSRIAEGEAEGHWWVLHTRPRTEKVVARTLRQTGDAFFLPMGVTKRLVQRRWVETQLPLFAGYFFLYGTEHSYHRAIKTNKIVSALEVQDQERLHKDLSSLSLLLEAKHQLSLHPGLAVGDQVEITSGSLAGLKGVVTRRDGETRIIVEVKMLNQQVSAQIDGCLLQKL